jgi:serine/threonine protein kinase
MADRPAVPVIRYARIKELGRGQHGRVWLCEDTEAPPEERPRLLVRRMRRPVSPCSSLTELNVEQAIKSVNREDRRQRSLRRSQQQYRQHQAQANQTDSNETRKTAIPADDKVMQEIAIMKRCHHKHVVKLIEVIDDAKSKKIFMGPSLLPLGLESARLICPISARIYVGRSDRMAGRGDKDSQDDGRRGKAGLPGRRARTRLSYAVLAPFGLHS